MSDTDVRPIHLHTVESLCADLISGRSVGLQGSNTFALPTADSRAILNWYYGRRTRWHANLTEADAEDIADALTEEPPDLAAINLAKSSAKRRLRLTKLQAHRFGGIHAYGTKDSPPDDFTFIPSTKLSLFEGANGSGKTSLLNAAIWCLTGSLLRAQRPPAEGDAEFICLIERQLEEGADNETSEHLLTPVTPLPEPGRYAPPVGEAIPVDTWVELTFVDDQGVVYPPIRRTQRRKSNGKIDENEPNLKSLGVDPIAFRMGTIMPAMLQHVHIGSASDLGKAVSELTGLSALTVLKGHASRARNYLLTKATKKRDGEIEGADQEFNVARTDLEERIKEFPAMAPEVELPTPSASDQVETTLATLKSHFDQCKNDALKEAQAILGSDFDPEDNEAREDLIENIGPARTELKRLDQMPSMARLSRLSRLTQGEEDIARALLSRIRAEAETLAALASEPDLVPRTQMYAHLASWMKEYGIADTLTCHACVRAADGVKDPVSGRPFSEHLQEALAADSELIAQTIESWRESRLLQLAGELPEALAGERLNDLPAHPSRLIQTGIVDELFGEEPFLGSLAALKKAHEDLCGVELATLPDLDEPAKNPLPEGISDTAKPLELALARIDRALAFAEWRRSANADVEAAISKVLGSDLIPADDGEPTSDVATLSAKLTALKDTVDGSAPIRNAIDYSGRMTAALQKRRTAETRIETYKKAAEALTQIEGLGGLATAQVDGLQKTLGENARAWKDKIYQDAVTSHQLQRTTMPADGVLEFQVGSEEITAPAQHISNASALRASLVGFYFAFREHVLETRGGLDLLVFDDPHELLDEHNREKMGLALVELASAGAQLLLTTYDQRFAQVVVAEGGKEHLVAHFSIHPVNAQRDLLELSDSKLQVEEKAGHFKQKIDDHDAAREYANSVRIYLESRLRDLFDDPTYPAYASGTPKPLFGDHLDHLRALVACGLNPLFKHPLVKGFSSDVRLQSTHECYRLLNDAHHNPGKVSYGRVSAVAADLKALRVSVDKMHQAFRDFRWQNKLPPASANDNFVPLDCLLPPQLTCPIYPDLAAVAGTGGTGGSQDVPHDELLGQWFTDKALFLLRSDNLGLAIPSGAIAIVEATPSEGRDRNLVIARQEDRVLARRLFRDTESDNWTLAAETPDPRKSPPTEIIKSGEFATHRIVGCLLLDVPFHPSQNNKQEAVQIDGAKLLPKIQAAYKLDQESAIPFALPGQTLLGGEPILPSEYEQHKGRLAAITLTDGSRLLKRIGDTTGSKLGYIRHFETIGGLGASVLLQTESIEDSPIDAPVIQSARLGIGVIYEL